MPAQDSDHRYLEDEMREESPREAVEDDLHRAKDTVSRGAAGSERAVSDRKARTAATQAYLLLRTTFTVAPILFGVDKFFDFMVEWTTYLAPWIESLAPVDAQTFMYGVGVVEILGGLLVAVAPRIGAPIVALWLLLIIGNLVTYDPPQYYDIALRDLGLMLGALTLTRLAWGLARSK